MRILLLQPPFHSLDRPSLGITNLAGVLRAAGHQVEVDYVNLAFAAQVGEDAYRLVDDRLPVQVLAGDLAFSPALTGVPLPPPPELRDLVHRTFGAEVSAEHAAHVAATIARLATEAERLCHDVGDAVASRDPDLVGVSAIFQVAPALALARAAKAAAPHIPVVLGGSHCEGPMGVALHEHHRFLDHVARGEGEDLVLELVEALEGRRELAEVSGLVHRDAHGRTIVNAERDDVVDLDALPPPDYREWIDQRRRVGAERDLAEVTLPVETSRGCWYGARSQCTFCGLNGEKIAFRSKTPERAVRDIAHVGALGGAVAATDNIIDSAYYETTLVELARRPTRHSIFYEVKSNLSDHQVGRLAAAGVRSIQPGIESLSTPVLRRMRKGVTAVQNVRLLRACAAHRVNPIWNVLCGFTGDRVEEYEEMATLMAHLHHLVPPVFESLPVRVDRFSPMFVSPDEHGLRDLRPVAGYQVVFGVDPTSAEGHDLLDRAAYYFDFDRGEHDRAVSRRCEEVLSAAVGPWHRAVGQAVLGSLTDPGGGGATVVERRPDQAPAACSLDGDEAALLEALGDGPNPAQLAGRTSLDPARVDDLVGRWVERGWCVRLDGRVQSVVVPLDAYLDDVHDLGPAHVTSDQARARAETAAEGYGRAMAEYWAGAPAGSRDDDVADATPVAITT